MSWKDPLPMTFNGTDEYFDTGIALTGWTEFTIFYRATRSVDGTFYHGMYHTGVNAARLGRGGGPLLGNSGDITNHSTFPTPYPNIDEEYTVALTSKRNANTYLYINNNQQESFEEPDWNFTSPLTFYIGANNVDGTPLQFSPETILDFWLDNRQYSADQLLYLETKGESGVNPGKPRWRPPTTTSLQVPWFWYF